MAILHLFGSPLPPPTTRHNQTDAFIYFFATISSNLSSLLCSLTTNNILQSSMSQSAKVYGKKAALATKQSKAPLVPPGLTKPQSNVEMVETDNPCFRSHYNVYLTIAL